MHDTADLVAETYALGAGPWTLTPVTRGALGQIWKLVSSTSEPGSSWAVKELLFGCDEDQVRQEAALREAAEKLGIVSPRLMPNRKGAYVSHLDRDSGSGSSGGSHVKLYDWIDGTPADVSDPDVLDWFGRTMALLHRAGEGERVMPSAWYERCPGDDEWAVLRAEVGRAGMPWADELGRFIAGPQGSWRTG